MTLLFIHMHHLINEFRPHQARETLRVMMQMQRRQRLETAERFQKHLEKVGLSADTSTDIESAWSSFLLLRFMSVLLITLSAQWVVRFSLFLFTPVLSFQVQETIDSALKALPGDSDLETKLTIKTEPMDTGDKTREGADAQHREPAFKRVRMEVNGYDRDDGEESEGDVNALDEMMCDIVDALS